MFESNNYLAAIERRKDDIALADEYRQGRYAPGSNILIDKLVKLLKSVRKGMPVASHAKRHTPIPISHALELVYFHHFMYRKHHKQHVGLQGAR